VLSFDEKAKVVMSMVTGTLKRTVHPFVAAVAATASCDMQHQPYIPSFSRSVEHFLIHAGDSFPMLILNNALRPEAARDALSRISCCEQEHL
jgi:hypothetical protein